jgi:DNA mismatch repair ATPase MutS
LPRDLQQTAGALAQLDVLAAFARDGAAAQLLPAGNRRGGRDEIRDGRHPVLEQI